jgi:hypothetical protein
MGYRLFIEESKSNLNNTLEEVMVSVAFYGTTEDVQKEAQGLNLRITAKQAERLLKKCSRKINAVILDAAREVIKEEVEMLWLDQEDRQLR